MSVKVIVQIGIAKNRKKTQSVKAYVNDEELSWRDGSGTYLTTLKDRKFKGMIWYMCSTDLSKEDVLKITVNTFLPGVGRDDENTLTTLYYADEEAPVREVFLRDVGMKNYPLIKGRVLEIGTVSEDDKRKADIEDFLNEGF